jgi:hypothetical protein
MALDVAMNAALQQPASMICCLIQIVLPGHTVRIHDGAIPITHDGHLYEGEDEVFGTLEGVEDVTEQVGTEAPTVRFTFLPTSIAAMAEITSPQTQGSEVSIWFGVIDPNAGQLIGAPELLFLGEIDTADVDVDMNLTVISFDVASAWERLFEASEGQRLNNSFQQFMYPGDLGMEFVTQIQREEPWGYDAVRPAVVRDVTGGAPGGSLINSGSGVIGGGSW